MSVHANDKRRQHMEKFNDVNSPCLIVFFDKTSQKLEIINGSAEAVLDCTEEELCALFKGEADRYLAPFSSLIAQERSCPQVLYRNSRRTTLVDFTCAPFGDNGILCIFDDGRKNEGLLRIYDSAAPAGIFSIPEGSFRMENVNWFFFEMSGYSQEDFHYEADKLFSGVNKNNFVNAVERVFATNERMFIQCKMETAFGELAVSVSGFVAENSNGVRELRICILSENELELYRRYLDAYRADFAEVSSTVAGGSFACYIKNGKLEYVSKPPTDALQKNVSISLNKQISDQWHEKIAENYLKDKFDFDCSYIRNDGQRRYMKFDMHLLRQYDDVRHFVCFYGETDEVRNNILKLKELQMRHKLLLEFSSDVIFSYDFATDVMRYMNGHTIRHRSVQQEIIHDFRKYDKLNEWQVTDSNVTLEGLLTGKVYSDIEVFHQFFRNGVAEEQWYLMKNRVISDPSGVPVSMVGTLHNITGEKLAQLELEKTNNTDTLTGLLNSAAFLKKGVELFRENRKRDAKDAVVAFTVTNLSVLNETIGVLFGDTVLKNLSATAGAVFGKEPVIGRIYGNLIAVYLSDFEDRNIVYELAERVYDNFSGIFADVSEVSRAKLRAGIAFGGDNRTKDFTALCHGAQMAAETTTLKGKYVVYSEEMNDFYSDGQAIDNSEAANISVAMDPLTAQLSRTLITTDDSDAAVSSALALIGTRYGLARAYILEQIEESDRMSIVFEWCAENVVRNKKQLQNMHIMDLEIYEKNYADDYFKTDRTDLITGMFPQANACYGDGKAVSVLHFPIRDGGKLCGFIGYDRTVGDYTEEELQQLQMISGFIGAQIVKLRNRSQQNSEHDIFRSLISHMNLFVYSVDPETYRILYARYTSNDDKSLLGKICYKEIRGRETPCVNCPMQGLSSGSDTHSMRAFNEKKQVWEDITTFKTRDHYGRESVIVACHDISGYNRFISDTDELTGSPDFRLFIPTVERALKNNPDTGYAMLFVNIRKLRIINETYGFDKGNQVLIAVSQVLQSKLSEGETLARISGNCFVVFERISSLPTDHTLDQLCEILRESVYEKLYGTVDISYLNFFVGAYLLEERGKGISATDMMDKSCIASKMAAKKHLVNKAVIYDDSLANLEERVAYLESRMEPALEGNEFKLFLQAKFNLKTKCISGAEALVRWIQPDGKMVMPGDFIPLFEQNGFIVKLDFYIYEQVLKLLRRWLDNGIPPILISVNISRAHVSDEGFADKLMKLHAKYNIPASMVELELTETMFTDNHKKMVAFMENLHNLGFYISIDDFGSGYSALNMLKDIPADIIKLDKSLFTEKENFKEKKLLKGIVDIARSMNFSTICEGVETRDQADFLEKINCDCAQGFLFHRPIDYKSFEKMYCECWQPGCSAETPCYM